MERLIQAALITSLLYSIAGLSTSTKIPPQTSSPLSEIPGSTFSSQSDFIN
jgi:hypothetical protein